MALAKKNTPTAIVMKVNGEALATPIKLSDYTFTTGDLWIEARYTPIVYTATFRVDGTIVAEVPFTVNGFLDTIPTLPAKKGYKGAWSSYAIAPQSMTIDAQYTLIQYTATFFN